MFEQAGVALAIENHDRFGVAMLVEILQRRNSPATGICLDIVNSFGALEGPKVVVEASAPWTLNLHVKDFVVRRVSHSMGFTVEGRPAGQGQLIFRGYWNSCTCAGGTVTQFWSCGHHQGQPLPRRSSRNMNGRRPVWRICVS